MLASAFAITLVVAAAALMLSDDQGVSRGHAAVVSLLEKVVKGASAAPAHPGAHAAKKPAAAAAAKPPAMTAAMKAEEKKHVMACAKKITGDDTPRKLAPDVRDKVMKCAGLYMPPVHTNELLKAAAAKVLAAAKTPEEKKDAQHVLAGKAADPNGWAAAKKPAEAKEGVNKAVAKTTTASSSTQAKQAQVKASVAPAK